MHLADSGTKDTQSSTGTGQEQSVPDTRRQQVNLEEGSTGRADVDADRDVQVGTNKDGFGEEAVDVDRAKQAAPDTNLPEQEDVDAGKDGVHGAYRETSRNKVVQTDFDTAND